MADQTGLNIYSIAAHRGFADALAAGLLARYAEPEFGLARLTLLLPSSRAARIVSEAFVRLSAGGLLLPRMAVAGDLDLDETLGALFDDMGAGAEIPPAADPVRRWLRLADMLGEVDGDAAGKGAARLRRAREIAGTMDRLLVEDVAPESLMSDEVVGIVGDLADHWRSSTVIFLKVQQMWLAELAARGAIDAPARRNLLFAHAAQKWANAPPTSPIVAAGVTSASPALARLLKVIAGLPQGAVVLPDLDLAMDDEVWEALGAAGMGDGPDDPPFARGDAVTHPQYHLKLLLNRMGVARGEVRNWHRAGIAAAPPERSRAISNLFLPPAASVRWAGLAADQRRLGGVQLMESGHPGEEATAIAILLREALEVPERRAALITPDRALAARVAAQLARWNIAADDTAGQPLTQTAAGRVLLLLAELLAEDAAPVPLIALLTHPLVGRGEDDSMGRARWLEQARRLDHALRGPRPAPGLAPLAGLAKEKGLETWWAGAEAMLAPLFALPQDAPLEASLDALCAAAEALCGLGLWGNADGRALAQFVEGLREAAREAGAELDPRELKSMLHEAMDRVSVRPPWGGHPRVAIYGLLEARMARADLIVCGGLTEGVWPASPAPDPLLPPPVLRALGVPGADFRIGLAAHDLAGALGAPEVVLSWARRDAGAPVIPSRFVLRIKAMLGDNADKHEETRAVMLAQAIDNADPAPPYPRPRPMPSAEQRRVEVSATGLDRLRSDPYQFYASAVLELKALDGLDAEPSPAWKGIAVHEILEKWHEQGGAPGTLLPIADQVLQKMNAHPLMRGLWRPRLFRGLEWIDATVGELADAGRNVAASEVWGDMHVDGIRVHGRADRIDRLADGTLAIVDYKTGMPPSRRMVRQGYSLQLGVIGLIAAAGGFKEAAGDPTEFEYWSLAKDKKRRADNGFGYVEEPFKTAKAKDGLDKEEFLEVTRGHLENAIARWITGNNPFTARLNLDVPVYNDYDQLMRLDEWLPRLSPEEAEEA